MRRYRILSFDFDSRATILRERPSPEWEGKVRTQWEANRASVEAGLVREFGEVASEAKRANFVAIGPRPLSVLAFHNRFAAQHRTAFVAGAYYPALTAACALGERILNHLVLRLREYYRSTPEYKRVHGKDSFDRWQLAIDTLAAWHVLQPDAIEAFRDLEAVRNRALHFHPATDTNDRVLALEALSLIDRIITAQFPVMGLQPWFIPHSKGESFIRREAEKVPFVREIYLPNCLYVGPYHSITQLAPELIVQDRDDYANCEISDEDYLKLREDGYRPSAR